MRNARATRLLGLAFAVVALAACGSDDDQRGAAPSSSAPTTPRAAAFSGADLAAAGELAYTVARERFIADKAFPRTPVQFQQLAEGIAAKLPTTITAPPAGSSWTVQTYSGDYGGKALNACSDRGLQIRVIVTTTGKAIGYGAADGTNATAQLYDPSKKGKQGFDAQGFYSQASACATDDTAVTATAQASKAGTF